MRSSRSSSTRLTAPVGGTAPEQAQRRQRQIGGADQRAFAATGNLKMIEHQSASRRDQNTIQISAAATMASSAERGTTPK